MNTNIHVFVYGTLRPGGALAGLMPGDHIGGALLPGASLYRHFGARFPVVDAYDSPDTVRGDVFRVSLPELSFAAEMEFGAGYEPIWRDVMVAGSEPGDFHRVTALVFGWPEYAPVGPHIPSGDWFGSDAVNVCQDLSRNAGFVTRKDSN